MLPSLHRHKRPMTPTQALVYRHVFMPRARECHMFGASLIREPRGVPPRLLDVGCGSGEITRIIAGRYPNAEVVGVDPSRHMLRYAYADQRERPLRNLTFQEAGAEALPFEDGSFDGVIVFGALKHFVDAGQALREIVRVTREGGQVLLGEGAHADSADALLRAVKTFGVARGAFFRAWLMHEGVRESDVREVMAAAGLRSIRVPREHEIPYVVLEGEVARGG